MPTVRVSLAIDRPPAEVFLFAVDQRNRARLLPDNFTAFRPLTDSRDAPGARFTFTIQTDRGAYASVTELVAVDAPAGFDERTTDGAAAYDTSWRFSARGGG